MNVLRNRSIWIVPAVGLLVGTLGLVGCGGGDNGNGFVVDLSKPIPVVTAIPHKAENPIGFTRGQSVSLVDLTGKLRAFIDGTLLITDKGTLGIQLIPTADGVTTRARIVPGLPAGFDPFAEFEIGQVRADGILDIRSVEPSIPGTVVRFELDPATAARLRGLLGQGPFRLSLRYLSTNALDVLNFLPTVTPRFEGDTVVFTVPRPGYYVLSVDDSRHVQGTVTPG